MESVFKNGGDWEGGGERNRKCFVYNIVLPPPFWWLLR